MLAQPEDAATRMLIVLNQHSFEGQTGDELSKDVRRAMKLKLPITLVHLPELPGQSSGCPFEVRRHAFHDLGHELLSPQPPAHASADALFPCPWPYAAHVPQPIPYTL